MQAIISTGTPVTQSLNTEWFKHEVNPAYEFSFTLTDAGLVFKAARKASALIHPQGRRGVFQEELWKYDAAEFFITTPDKKRYMEFNLSPNGAWWACVFSAPRQVAIGYENWKPNITALGECREDAWSCEALIPSSVLQDVGIIPQDCFLAACAILNSPEQIFLTSALPCPGQPDFHRPDLWEKACLS